MKRNDKLSKKLSVNSEPKECWNNAIKGLFSLGYGLYVEGWVVCLDIKIPIEHGWLEVNGEIVETTSAILKHETVYFPGVKYTLEEVSDELEEMTPPFAWKHGWGGRKLESYTRAEQEAYLFCVDK